MDISRSTPKNASTLKTVRRELRARRRLLSSHEQWLHAAALARVLGSDPRFRCARWIATYWPADGEMDPGPLLALAGRPGRRAFLPVLRPDQPSRLWFFPYAPGDPLRANRLGIPEPRRGRQVALPPWALDLILVPLVGFDADCNRLGMGGGYYDRTLAFLHRRRYWHRPRLIGLAHECQRVHRLEPRPWDVPLDAVATERRLYRRGRSRPPMGDQAISEKPLTPGIAGRPAKIR